MSTQLPELEAALAAVPATFRTRLLTAYAELKDAYTKGQYDTCGLRAGKFCEIMLRYLDEALTGSHTPFGHRISNFTDVCRSLEKLPKTSGSESFRVIIPRALDLIYTLRNKRDIGHVGGDIDANEIDAATSVRGVDWCIAELIRVVHHVPLEDAQQLLDAIAARQIPMVWAVGGTKRVLDSKLSQSEQTLVLLYSEPETAVPVEDLAAWVDVSKMSDYKSRVLLPLHRKRLIEYDLDTCTAILSPTGASRAEKLIARGLV